ncbi:autotransporter assembly complex protein TamA [Roseixanthobacter liquoris]|uniref:autotransporter assembly complex protein TamA n=1 Tax=Roseixanthobacter liquoris TaxID=3119921 RepID=UPI00372CE605
MSRNIAPCAAALRGSCLSGLLLLGCFFTPAALAQAPAAQPAQSSEPASADNAATFFDRAMAWFDPDRAKDEAPAADAVPYTVTFDVTGEPSLRSNVSGASNLESLKRNAPSGAAGLVRRALADRDRILAALYAEGYYAGTVTILVAGRPPDAPDVFPAVDAARAAGPVPVVVKVATGPRFTFGTILVLDAATKRPLAEAPTPRALRLIAGEPARSTAVLGAEGTIVAALRDSAHPFAKVVGKDVVADHAGHTLNVTFLVAPGPVATFGPFTVAGTKTLKPEFVSERIEIRPGEPFSPARLAALRKRLLTFEIIGGVRFKEADRLNAQGQLPIEVEISERDPRYVGFSAKYSNTDGSAANVFWGHRNLFGGGETLRLDGQVSWFGKEPDSVPNADPFGYRFAATFMKPGIITPNDDLVAQAAILREVTNAYVRQGETFVGGIRHRFDDTLNVQVGVDLEQSQVENAISLRDYTIVGVPVEANYDTTDSLLDASRGIRASATIEPFALFGQSGAGPMLMKGSIAAYHALDEDKRYILAGRVQAGSIVGADFYDAPPQRLFYVGGGGTLRGYDYQSASPRDAFGDIIGGLSFFAASVEARIRVTDTIGIVPFLDMGAAFASETPDLSELQYGYGIGLRYYTAIGPIRLDLAFPVNPQVAGTHYGLYVSLGQSF